VLLERRSDEASLMAGMLELPPLPLDAVEGREPVLRVRHAITNTNYYVMIFAEQAPGLPPQTADLSDETMLAAHESFVAPVRDTRRMEAEDDPYVAHPLSEDEELSLTSSIAVSPSDLLWFPASRLPALALTGLTRKVLRRLGVMTIAKPARA
jgi:hypothetical protein